MNWDDFNRFMEYIMVAAVLLGLWAVQRRKSRKAAPASPAAQPAAPHAGAHSFTFGDSPELNARLLALVRSGRKTATCEARRAFAPEGAETMPEVGRRDIALDWQGRPALLLETTEVTLRRFDEVDAAFALDEGENDDLAGWQRDHRAYFERTGGWSPEMMLVCERFRLIEDLAGQGGADV